jgi:hypothetical protein
MDFPGGSVPFSNQMTFIGSPVTPSPTACYRTLDSTGEFSDAARLLIFTSQAVHVTKTAVGSGQPGEQGLGPRRSKNRGGRYPT